MQKVGSQKNSPVPEAFPKMLNSLMDRSGISVIEIAKQLDVHRQTVYKWKQGNAMPSEAKLVALSQIFDVAPAVLVYGSMSLDEVALGEILEAIFEFSEGREEKLSPKKFSKLVNLFYSDFLEMGRVPSRERMDLILSMAMAA